MTTRFVQRDDLVRIAKGELPTGFASMESFNWGGSTFLLNTRSARPRKRLLEQDLQSETLTGGMWLAPTDNPVAERIASRVRSRPTLSVVRAKDNLSSPEYFATLRRRLVKSLLPAVEQLQDFECSENFVVLTRSIVDEIREGLRTLESFKTEGNSRAILRQVRDTFLNGGWEQWRDKQKRAVGTAVLGILLTHGDITPLDVDSCFDKLLDAGLTPVALPALDFGDDAEHHVNADISG